MLNIMFYYGIIYQTVGFNCVIAFGFTIYLLYTWKKQMDSFVIYPEQFKKALNLLEFSKKKQISFEALLLHYCSCIYKYNQE
jgi:hypothetical protein